MDLGGSIQYPIATGPGFNALIERIVDEKIFVETRRRCSYD